MPEPVILPPTPTVVQGEPIDTSPGIEQVQKIFDRIAPDRSQLTKQAEKPAEAAKEPVKPAEKPADKPAEPPKDKTDTAQVDVPSFLEQALRGEPSQPATSAAPAAAAEEWPEELPEFKNSDEAKARYKAWRASYGQVKDELKALREKPTLNAAQLQRLDLLESQNKQMSEVLTRYGVEQSAEFQQQILRPLHVAWQEAARIVQQAGGDPNELAKAMSLNGRAQFEALDTIFGQMPESAKAEANEALRAYRRYDEARRQTLANAPVAMEGIQRRETERRLQEVNRQRNEMSGMFDAAIARLRDEAKLEVLIKTDSPEGKWWNDQGERLVNQARELFLENTDMNRVAMACALAPAADVYRRLWINSQKKIGDLQKIIKDRIGSEPSLSESGGPGNILPADQQLSEDLKKPFSDVFLREFHRSQQRAGVR